MDKNNRIIPEHIEVRGARTNNLKNIDVDIPLNKYVAVCGVSGSGKSTLAIDVLYAEGSRRYLQALSTYTRRRIGQTARPNVDSIHYLPSSIALRQRPTVPSIRSTVGTMSEVLNVLRLSFSRLGSHICPNGHRLEPSLDMAQLGETTCPVCGVKFNPPSAEDFAFNSMGACPKCHGTGICETINEKALIADENKTIREGAVAGWKVPGSFFYVPAAESVGIPIDIPYKDLTDEQKDFVLHGVKEERVPVHITITNGKEYDMTAQYLNAADAVAHAYNKTESEKIRSKLADQFYHVDVCPECHGSRFKPSLLQTLLNGKNIAEVSMLSLEDLYNFAQKVPDTLPERMKSIGNKLMGELEDGVKPLLELGLSYLTLDRGGNTLSTGELQRIQLARTLKNETTGVLYVLDEPSIGLHPMNVEGLVHIFNKLLEQGNSLVVVDHDTDILSKADWMIEMGPGAGEHGGTVISEGTVEGVINNKNSIIKGFLDGKEDLLVRDNKSVNKTDMINLKIKEIYTLKNLKVTFPIGKLTAITGVSGSGKSTLVLDCLVPAMKAKLKNKELPTHIESIDTATIKRVVTVDATPVGKNVRSTVATYSGILDDIRNIFADTKEAKKRKFTASYFSYNLKDGVCQTCSGTGKINLDIQYLPDMELTCPDCQGKRYSKEVLEVLWNDMNIADILDLTVEKALEVFKDIPSIYSKLDSLAGLGLGYLKLGEPTPDLSGGEAQRLKLVSEIGKNQKGTLFVFDEPTTGLHPKDIRKLLNVLDILIKSGGTVIVIEHDLDMISNADYCIDMGPGGGINGGKILVTGTPEEICKCKESNTGKYLSKYVKKYGYDW